MDWIQQWQSKLNKQNGVAPLVRTGGSRHTGLAALPYRNIHIISNILFLISPLPDNNSFLHKRTTYVKITTSIYQNCTLLNVP